MFWKPRFVSPIAIRFSFGRGLRDATRRGTWSRLRWVARDVRAPGRSQSGPVRACLLASGDRLFVAGAVRAAGFGSVDLVLRRTPSGRAVPEIDTVRVVGSLDTCDVACDGHRHSRQDRSDKNVPSLA